MGAIVHVACAQDWVFVLPCVWGELHVVGSRPKASGIVGDRPDCLQVLDVTGRERCATLKRSDKWLS